MQCQSHPFRSRSGLGGHTILLELILKYYIVYFICMHMCVHMGLHTGLCPWRTEEVMWFHGAGTTGGLELTDLGARS